MKRMLSMLLVVCLLIGACPIVGSATEWVASCPQLFSRTYVSRLTGDVATDLVAVGQAQKGQAFGGATGGYSADWCAYFVCDAAYLAGVPSAVIPYTLSGRGSVRTLYTALTEQCGATVLSDQTTAQPGDLIFYVSRNTAGQITTYRHVEIVGSTVSSTGLMTVIGGNTGNNDFTRSVVSVYSVHPSETGTIVVRPAYSSIALQAAETGVSISWPAVANASAYRVYRRSTTTDSWSRLAQVSAAQLTYLDDTAVAGEGAYYTVRAVIGSAAAASYDRVGSFLVWLPKTSVVASTGAVSWDEVTGATGYLITRLTGDDEVYLGAAEAGVTHWADADGTEGCAYTVTPFAAVDETDTTADASASRVSYGQTAVSAGTTALSTPSVTAQNTDEGIVIQWSAVSGAAEYEIYTRLSGGHWKRIAIVQDSLSYTYTGASEGVCYGITVKAINGAASSQYVTTCSLTRLATPQVSLALTDAGMKISWEAITGATAYAVYHRQPGGVWARLTNTSELSYTDTQLLSGVTYDFTVRAMADSHYSAYTAVSGLYLSMPEVTTANVSAGTRLSWSSVPGAETYQVYRRLPGGAWKLLDTIENVSYTDEAVVSGTTYEYAVRAKTETARSGYQVVSHTYLQMPEVTATNTAEGVEVTWSEVKGAESYLVYRREPGGSWKRVHTTDQVGSYTITGLTEGVAYSFTVKAIAGEVSSAYPTVALVRLTAAAVTATNTEEGVELSWNAVAGATAYQIDRQVDGQWQLAATVTQTTWVDTTVVSGQSTLYRVTPTAGSSWGLSTQQEAFWLAAPAAQASNSTTGALIQWSAVDGATEYRVYKQQTSGEWNCVTSTAETSWTDGEAVSGQTAAYAVQATAGEQQSATGPTASLYVLGTPAVSTVNAVDGVTISWEAVPGATSYRVYRRTAGGGWKTMAVTGGLTYTDTAATSGETLGYTVRAIAGNEMSAYVSDVWQLVLAAPSITLANDTTGVKVSWAAVPGATTYRVYRRVSGVWKLIAKTAETSWIDVDASSGQTEAYTVRAVAGSVLSGYRAETELLVLSAPAVSTVNSVDGVTISWAAVPGATSYRVYRRTAGGGWKTMTVTGGLTYTDTAATSGQTLGYTVRAIAGSEMSAYVSDVWQLVLAAPSITLANDTTGVKVSWAAVPGATAYRVYRRVSGAWKLIAKTAETSWIDVDASSGQTEAYTVRAVAGNVLSGYRAGTTVFVLSTPAVSVANTAKGVKVSWAAVPGATTYRVYRRTTGGGWKTIAVTGSLTYTDATAPTGQTLGYTVRAIAVSEMSGYVTQVWLTS